MKDPLSLSRRHPWLVLGVLLLMFGVAIVVMSYRERLAIAAQERHRLESQARVVEENLHRQLQGVASALSGLRDAVGPLSPAEAHADVDAKLALLGSAMPGVRTMAILDADGTVVASGKPELLGRNFGHREYFDVPRRFPDRATLYVSPPIKANVDGFVVFVTKAMLGPDGRFAGIVAATLNPDYFDVVLRSVVYAPDMRTTLVHGDGKVFITVPANEAALGMDLTGPDTVLGKHRQTGRLADVIIAPGIAGGDERLLALRTVTGSGLWMDKALVVILSRDLSAVFEAWRDKAVRLTAFFLVVTLAACAGLYASRRRRATIDRLAAEASRERQQGAERLELALRGADLGLWDIHVPSNTAVVNARESEMLGYASADDLVRSTTWQSLVHPDDMAVVHAAMRAHLKGRRATFDCEHRIRHRDGRWLWICSRAMVTERDASGAAVRVIGTHLDITDRKRTDAELASAAARLRESEERLSLSLEGSGLSLFDWNIAENRLFHSAHAAALRGDEPVDQVTTPQEAREHVHPDDVEGMLARIKGALTGATPRYHAEFRVRTRAGSWLWVSARGRVVERDPKGRAVRLAGTYSNIDERKLAEQRLRHLAEFDTLTSLPNRALFYDRLRQAISRTKRTGPIALLFLDIDHFKRINDTLGHEAGDQLLKVFAQRMRAVVRESDTVARLAGDEFTIILEGLREPADARRVAGKLVEALREPVALAGTWLQVTTSIGIAMPLAGDTEDDVLRRADAALYEAKRKGRNGYAWDAAADACTVPGRVVLPGSIVH